MASSSSSPKGDQKQLRELLELISESWYWPGASKTDIAKAMENKPDGTFVVRDASTPGDFTLTVRARGETKLVKINVLGGRCGFNVLSLDYDSIQSLIEHHRRTSLQSYNANLDTMLQFPLRDARRRQSGDEEFERYLAIERFRTYKCAFMRATKIYDLYHGEHIRAENLLKTQHNALADVKKKIRMVEEVKRKQSEVIDGLGDDRKATVFQANGEVIQTILGTLHSEEEAIGQHMTKLEEFMEQQERDLNSGSERLQLLSTKLEKLMAELRGGKENKGGLKGILSDEHLQQISEKVETMRQVHESIAVARILYDLPLRWDPARFLVNDPSKEAAAVMIEAARARLLSDWKEKKEREKGDSPVPTFDGLFLIRPSASQHGRLVLSVLTGGRVNHCLIEEAEHGWGFENGGLYFVSIGDFVRYYAHNSLEEHNKHIKTALTEPVLL